MPKQAVLSRAPSGQQVGETWPPPLLPGPYLLGLLAMIKCSICSYQCDNWYVSNWRLACHIYFSLGRRSLELAQSPSCVALAWHLAGRSTPFGVTYLDSSSHVWTSVGVWQYQALDLPELLAHLFRSPACLSRWAEAHIKIARMTLTIKLDGNWSSFQLANSAPPLSVTGSAIAPSARMSYPYSQRHFAARCSLTLYRADVMVKARRVQGLSLAS